MVREIVLLTGLLFISGCNSDTKRADNYMFIVDSSSKASLSFDEWSNLPAATKKHTAAKYYLQNLASEKQKKKFLSGDMKALYKIANDLVECSEMDAKEYVENKYGYGSNSLAYCAKSLGYSRAS